MATFPRYRDRDPKNVFDEEIINLMDFTRDQRNDVHFFYTLPFIKNSFN